MSPPPVALLTKKVSRPSANAASTRGYRPLAREPHTQRFRVHAPSGSQVAIAGTFNHWAADAHPLQERLDQPGLFELALALPPGRYEYKFVINGEWCADVRCPRWVINEMRTLNSVLVVEDPGPP